MLHNSKKCNISNRCSMHRILQRNPLKCNCSVAFLRQGTEGLSSMLPWLAVTDGTVGDDELRCIKDSFLSGDEYCRLSDLDYDDDYICGECFRLQQRSKDRIN